MQRSCPRGHSRTRSSRRHRFAFTGLAAAVAFRVRLFNIGAEGQLYLGAIGAAGIALYLADQPTAVIVPAMIVVGAAAGAAWAAIPGLLRAFAHTNEIITSLMLNYCAALLLNYLIFDSQSYWRDDSATGQLFPQGKTLADAATWPVWTIGSIAIPSASSSAWRSQSSSGSSMPARASDWRRR